MIDQSHSLIIIAVMAVCTMLLRFLPFILFSKNTPKFVLYLGEVLPYAVIAMLVVYCLKGIDFLGGDHGLPEIISVLFVILLHKWRHNTLLSILGGTICYMLLIQLVFT
ncbi:MAG: AzlD domain-containing protein [Lachnospiraceae bacterium]|nr:AzlD domain-containing protein [Lachnospiraceae bacterium]